MVQIPRIAVIGGGLTGTAAAIELLRTVSHPFDLVIIEPEEQLGRGLAYGKAESFHLLNVRAGKLGVLHGQPNDFAAWARCRGLGLRPRLDPPEPTRAFLSRRLFGAYVEARLVEQVATRADVNFAHLRSVAAGVRRTPSGYEIDLEDRTTIKAEIVVLATGYGRSSASSQFGRKPFADIDSNRARSARTALFVGTGLTFVDEFLRLRSRGFRGQAVAVSRHGLLPELHRANEAPRDIRSIAAGRSVAALFGSFRQAMAGDEMPASAAVDLGLGLRSEIQSVWQALGVRQQRQFLRHLRSHWNVVRHRLPPEVHAQLRHAMQGGALNIAAGRVLDRRGDEVRIQMRGGEPVDRRFDLVFDCTGHRPDITNPVALSLIRQGLARPDPHRLGLSVAADGALISRPGSRSPGLFALGPLGHGSLFEITAVPEIVAQCAAMASTLQASLRRIRSAGHAERAVGVGIV